jgi:hypothetical protein
MLKAKGNAPVSGAFFSMKAPEIAIFHYFCSVKIMKNAGQELR